MTTRFADATTTAMLDARRTLIDAAATAGRLKGYGGATAPSLPTDPDVAAPDELVFDLALADPSFPAPSIVGANAESDAAAAVTGNAETGMTGGSRVVGYVVVEDGDGNVVETGDVTITGGGGYAELDNLTIADGQAINFTALKLAQHRDGTAA